MVQERYKADDFTDLLEFVKQEEFRIASTSERLRELFKTPLDALLQRIASKRDHVVEHFSERLGKRKDEAIAIVTSHDASSADLDYYSNHPMNEVRRRVAQNPNTSLRTLERMRRDPRNDGMISSLTVLAHPSANNMYKENYIRHSTTITPAEVKWMLAADEVYTGSKNYIDMEKKYKLTFASLEMLIENDFSYKDSLAHTSGEFIEAAKRQIQSNKELAVKILDDKITMYKENHFPLEMLEKLLSSDSPIEVYVAGIAQSSPPVIVKEAVMRLEEMRDTDLLSKLKEEVSSKMEIPGIQIEKTQALSASAPKM